MLFENVLEAKLDHTQRIEKGGGVTIGYSGITKGFSLLWFVDLKKSLYLYTVVQRIGSNCFNIYILEKGKNPLKIPPFECVLPGVVVSTSPWSSLEVVVPMSLLLMGFIYLYFNNRRLAVRLRKIAIARQELDGWVQAANDGAKQKEELLKQCEELESQLGAELESCQLALEFRTRQLSEVGELVSQIDGNRDLIRQIQLVTHRERNNRFLTRLGHMAYISRSTFVKKVAAQYPRVSHSDLELLYWMKMGLDTKMISELSFRSTGSVKVKRSRLRRKLGMDINSPSILAHLVSVFEAKDASKPSGGNNARHYREMDKI